MSPVRRLRVTIALAAAALVAAPERAAATSIVVKMTAEQAVWIYSATRVVEERCSLYQTDDAALDVILREGGVTRKDIEARYPPLIAAEKTRIVDAYSASPVPLCESLFTAMGDLSRFESPLRRR